MIKILRPVLIFTILCSGMVNASTNEMNKQDLRDITNFCLQEYGDWEDTYVRGSFNSCKFSCAQLESNYRNGWVTYRHNENSLTCVKNYGIKRTNLGDTFKEYFSNRDESPSTDPSLLW